LGLLFISPWLIGFLLFTLYPLASSFYDSLTRDGLLNPPNFVGLRNYVQFFAEDPHFGTVAYNTVYYVGLGAPLGVASAFTRRDIEQDTKLDTAKVARLTYAEWPHECSTNSPAIPSSACFVSARMFMPTCSPMIYCAI